MSFIKEYVHDMKGGPLARLSPFWERKNTVRAIFFWGQLSPFGKRKNTLHVIFFWGNRFMLRHGGEALRNTEKRRAPLMRYSAD